MDPVVLWEGEDGVLPGQVLLLADGSSVRVNTGSHSWALSDPDRPLQMWTVGAFHLDDGPLTPAASAFLTDLVTALEDPGAGGPGPSSHWLSQRATLDPATHRITEPGVARPWAEDAPVLVWDAALGWVDAARAGGLARVERQELIPADVFASWVNEPTAARTVDGAAEVVALLQETERAERLTTTPGTSEHAAAVDDRAQRRAVLRTRAGHWIANAVAPSVALFADQAVQVKAESNGRLLVELDHGRLAVVSLAVAENEALSGSRPGLQQSGTTSDIGQLRNELAAYPEYEALVKALTQELQEGAVRHFRVQGVLSDGAFVGMRVTEFEVTRPAHDEVGVRRAAVEPQRHIDPGFATHEAMRQAVAGWTPSSVTDAIKNALRWLPFINPMFDRFPDMPRVPWSNNCADCTRAAADLMQGRDARAAFGDNGGRVLDDHRYWGTDPGELNEMWRHAGTVGSWHTWHGHSSVFSPDFTAHANARIGDALASKPEGTVAMVLVNWANDLGKIAGGHWFNAAVTEDGVEWVDGQSAQHSAWPPPYTTPYYGYAVITRAQDSDTWVDLFGGPATASSLGRTSVSPAVPGAGRSKRGSFVPHPVDPERVAAHAGLNGPGYSARGSISFSMPPERVPLTAVDDAQHFASTAARSLATKVRSGFIELATAQLGDVAPSRRIVKQMAENMPRAAGALTTSSGELFTHTSLRGSAPDRIHPVVAAAYGFAEVDLGAGAAQWHGQCVEVALFSDALHAAEARGEGPSYLPPAGAPREDWSAALSWANAVLDGAVLDVVGTGLPTSVDELTAPKAVEPKEPCESCRWVLGRELRQDPRDYQPVQDGRVVPRLMLSTIRPMQLPPDAGETHAEPTSSGPGPSTGDGALARGEPELEPRGLGPIGFGLLSLSAADATFAARLSNPSGDWPEDEDDDAIASVGRASSMESATVSVEAPYGERRSLSVVWVDGGRGSAPVLILQEIPGQQFWWSVPEAVLQAVEQAREVLAPDPVRWARAVVVGRVPAQGQGSGLTQYPLDLTHGRVSRSAGVPRELAVDEARRALAYVGLR